MLHANICDGCGKTIDNNEEMIALIYVRATNKRTDGKVRLKLSESAVEDRVFRLFCKQCLRVSDFIVKE